MLNKVVFILGAGFSKAAGAPLVDEFLVVAKDIFANRHERLNDMEKKFFTNVFTYYDDLSKARSRFEFDIDNIEDLFSIIDMNITFSKDESIGAIKDSLIYLIIKTLEVSIGSQLHSHYTGFMKHLYDKHIDFSILTFNYDLILERALEKGSCLYNYCAFPESVPIKSDEKKILKLHGSANWLVGKECTHYSILEGKALGSLYNATCPECGKIMMPLLVPPTWNKKLENQYLKNVWYYAFEELKNCNSIIFIGYSLPKTDLYFRHFLTLALKNNINLQKIIVVNKDKAVKERFLGFLEKNFSRRHFHFIETMFERISVPDMMNGRQPGIAI